MKTLRTKCYYGPKDRPKAKDPNKPVGSQLQSISRGSSKTAKPGRISTPTANRADPSLEKI